MRPLLVAALAAALTVLGMPKIASAAFFGTCVGPGYPNGNNQHAYVDKANVTAIDLAQADVTYLRATHQCTGNGNTGQSYVLPVNLQGGSIGCAIQVGWGRSQSDSGDHWYATAADDASCVMIKMTGWPAPVVGHNYTLKIQPSSCIVPGWLVTMVDHTTTSTYTYCFQRAGSVLPTEMWSGFEVWDNNDQMGGAGTAQNIYDIGYRVSGQSTLTYLTTTTVNKLCCHNFMWENYWVVTASRDPDGHTVISGYTTNH